MSRILITGGAGFVGSHLAAASVAAGHQVHVVVRARSRLDRLAGLDGRIERHRFDLADEGELRRCLDAVRPEAIFHLAASPRRPERPGLEDVRDFVRDDLDTLVLLLREAAGARRPPGIVVRTGSLAEYGIGPVPYREDQREAPMTAYAANLVAATHFAAAIQPRLPFPVTTARLALVFGPMQSTEYLVPQLVSRCLAGEETLVRRPSDRRDLVFVDDIAVALLRLAFGARRPAGVINIASGVAPTMRQVAEMIVDLTGADPRSVRYGNDSRPTGAPDFIGSGGLAARLLGWRPLTPLRDGLERTIRSSAGSAWRDPERCSPAPGRSRRAMMTAGEPC